MLYGLVIAIHVIACIVLIAVILLQAGRGGGLSEAFGGSSSVETIFGTKTNVFLAKATTTAAIVYLATCLLLGIMTAKRGKSLINLSPQENTRQMPAAKPLERAQEEKTLDEAKKSLPEAKPEPAPVK